MLCNGQDIQPDLNSIEHAFHLPNGKYSRNKEGVKTGAVEVWQSIAMDEIQWQVMSKRSRLLAVIDCKGFATECSKYESLNYDCEFVPLLSIKKKWYSEPKCWCGIFTDLIISCLLVASEQYENVKTNDTFGSLTLMTHGGRKSLCMNTAYGWFP